MENKFMTKEEVMRILRINDERMLMYKNRFELEIVEGEEIRFDRTKLEKKIGTILDEPFLTLEEAASHIGVSRENFEQMARIGGVPFYSIEKVKGARRLFKKSELDAFKNEAQKISLDPHRYARNNSAVFHWMRGLMAHVLSDDIAGKFLTDRERDILSSIIVKAETLGEVGVKFGLTRERARQIFEKASRRINANLMRVFREMINERDSYKERYLNLLERSKATEFAVSMLSGGKNPLPNVGGDVLAMHGLLRTELKSLGFPARALSCLHAADIMTLAELVSFEKMKLLQFRNLGKKSLDEIVAIVESKNLHFGMDVTKYGFASNGKLK